MTGEYVIESGSYVQALDRALELIDFECFPELQRKMREEGRYFGLGISCGGEALARGATWYGARGLPISGQEGCQIQHRPEGQVHAPVRDDRAGTGHRDGARADCRRAARRRHLAT